VPVFILFIICSLFIATSSHSSEINIPGDFNIPLGTKFERLKNSDQPIDYVMQTNTWESIDDKIPNYGYIDESMWLKTTIINKKSSNHDFIFSIESSILDYIDIYVIKDNKIKSVFFSGDLRSLDKREISHRYTLIPLEIKKGDSIDLYLKIQSNGSVQLPMYLKDSSQSMTDLSTSSLLHGIFGGLILIMIIYNLFLFISFKESSYLFYVLFASSTLFFQSIEYGFATEYIWYDYALINDFIIPIILPLILISMSLFLIKVLEIKKQDTSSYYTITSLIFINFFIFLGSLIFEYNIMCQMGTFSAIITNIIHLIIAFKYAKNGDITTKFVLLALVSFVTGLILMSFEKIGILETNIITSNSLKVGQSIEILLLSIALSFKINKLVHQVSHDRLTGVMNRLGFDLEMKEKFESSNYRQSPITLLMLDVDKFKHINDRFGHVVGDKVLIHLSSIVKNIMSKYNGSVFRYGGEEFGVIIADSTSSHAKHIAEEIRAEIDSTPFYSKVDDVKINLTISIGCGHYNGTDDSNHYEDLIKYSDQLLYKAKDGGRNQVVCGEFE
jgi:diguanylate cyclase